MPYRNIAAFAILALLVFLSACKKAKQPIQAPVPKEPAVVQSTQATVTPIPAETGVLLKMKWPAGSRYICRMDLEQHSTNSISQAPKPHPEDLTFGVTYSLSVLSEGPDCGREIEVGILATEMEISVSGKVALHFDSTEAAKDPAQERIAAPFRKIIGSPLRLLIDADGKVDKVIGHKEWVERVSGAQPGRLEQLLVQQFNEGFFRQLADYGRGLPAKPVHLGESWPYKIEIPAGGLGKITLDSTISLKRWEDLPPRHLAVLESRGTLQSAPLEEENSSGMAIDQGTVTGTSWFDPEQGTLVESAVTQSMHIKGETPASATEHTPPVQFTSDIGQNVTVKLVEIGTSPKPVP